MNNVILIGRLTKEPEITYTKDNLAVARFTLAVDRMKKDETDFIRIVTFGKQAENCKKYLDKGKQVAIQGAIRTGSYQNKDGKTVYTTEILANNVQFLSSGRKEKKEEELPQGFYYDEADEDFPL